jgi:hypothetical protein
MRHRPQAADRQRRSAARILSVCVPCAPSLGRCCDNLQGRVASWSRTGETQVIQSNRRWPVTFIRWNATQQNEGLGRGPLTPSVRLPTLREDDNERGKWLRLAAPVPTGPHPRPLCPPQPGRSLDAIQGECAGPVSAALAAQLRIFGNSVVLIFCHSHSHAILA